MSKKFLKSNEIQLLNGGYLSDMDKNPIYNKSLVDCLKHAEYVVTFANLAKGKDFKGKKADSIEDLKKELNDLLFSKNVTEFVKKPTSVERPITAQLKEEAMSFLNFHTETEKVDKINKFLQQFNVLKEFEDFGLFFEDEIVKLNKIYTLQEVVDAVTQTIDLV